MVSIRLLLSISPLSPGFFQLQRLHRATSEHATQDGWAGTLSMENSMPPSHPECQACELPPHEPLRCGSSLWLSFPRTSCVPGARSPVPVRCQSLLPMPEAEVLAGVKGSARRSRLSIGRTGKSTGMGVRRWSRMSATNRWRELSIHSKNACRRLSGAWFGSATRHYWPESYT